MQSSTVLWYLAGIAIRSSALALLAVTGLLVLRGRSAASRHAVWTVVLAAMLALAVCEPLLPPLPLAVLRAAPAPAIAAPAPSTAGPAARSAVASVPVPGAPAERASGAGAMVLAVYLAGVLVFAARLAFGYLFTRRLVHASRPVEMASDIPVYDSTWISVPLTVGVARPRILLPAGWEQWAADKLSAVLAHESAHVRRADWGIAVMAGVNRCLFWFHPLSWWLERRLAMLAEQACDDTALATVPAGSYAQTLLDMAAAVKTGNGRLVWEAMAMANVAEVKKRIERVLDETRPVPRGFTRPRWAALIAASLPLIYVAAVVQPVPAQAPPEGIQDLLRGKRQMTIADASAMEEYLANKPHDLDARLQLIAYYFTGGTREQRLKHIYWLIANHPESSAVAAASRWLSARSTAFNDAADFRRAGELWELQVGNHPNDVRVLSNAAEFFALPGADSAQAEMLLNKARSIEPQNFSFRNRLASLYAAAILGSSGDPKFPDTGSAFAAHARQTLENSNDAPLTGWTGRLLVAVARRTEPGKPLPADVLNLDDHPMLVPVVDFGQRLIARAAQGGFPAPTSTTTAVSNLSSGQAETRPAAATIAAPTLVQKIDPQYPALARQARIQGVVNVRVTIGADGHVNRLQVISGHPLLVPPTLEAVKEWIYGPVPGGGTFDVQVPFTLPDGGVTGGVPGGVPGGVEGGIPGGMVPTKGTVRMTGTPTVRVGEQVQASKLVTKVDPEYPAVARSAHIQGKVTLEVTIGEDGRVQSVNNREGHPLLVNAAIEAVRQWVYRPTLLRSDPNGPPTEGTPCMVITTVTLNFQ